MRGLGYKHLPQDRPDMVARNLLASLREQKCGSIVQADCVQNYRAAVAPCLSSKAFSILRWLGRLGISDKRTGVRRSLNSY